jgi:dephospho-CoA kinase
MVNRRRKPVIGIVGGVGAGKSTVAAELVRLGCELIDADAIGHELLRGPTVRREVRKRWGAGVFSADGQVSRRALAAAVFGRRRELAALNRIMHHRIRRRMERRIAQLRRDPSVPGVVLDAAVLLEAGWDDLCTHVLFVRAPAGLRARRVSAARGWDRRTWRAREKSQISLDTKVKGCYGVVDNSSSVSHLRRQVRRVLHRIVHAVDRP